MQAGVGAAVAGGERRGGLWRALWRFQPVTFLPKKSRFVGAGPAVISYCFLPTYLGMVSKKKKNYTIKKRPRAHAVTLASARQHPENQKENQAGHSSERTVEGQFVKTSLHGTRT